LSSIPLLLGAVFDLSGSQEAGLKNGENEISGGGRGGWGERERGESERKKGEREERKSGARESRKRQER